MKKTYQKPEIIFEDFSLSTNIAAGCEKQTNMPSVNQCGIYFGGYYVFADGMTGCETWPITLDEEYNGFCYHTPTEGNNLFTS